MEKKLDQRKRIKSIIDLVREENKKEKKPPLNTTLKQKTNIAVNPMDPEEVITNIITGETVWYTESVIRQIANECYTYCRDEPRCLRITQFFSKRDMHIDIWRRWCLKYPFVANINKLCMQTLADKRETGMNFGELDRLAQMRVLHMYDQDWRDMNKYWTDLKKEEVASEQVGNITVVIPPTPNIDSVPMRKSKYEKETDSPSEDEQDTAI
jgi:hypothetical protein